MSKFTNHAEMVAALVKPGEAIIQSLTPLKAHLWHMASCVMGEVGELLEAIYQVDHDNIKEELGDIEFYLEGIRQSLNIDREKDLIIEDDFYGYVHLTNKAADLFDAIKKHVIYNKELDMKAVISAMKDIESCLGNIRGGNDINRDDTIQHNIAKLEKRYAEGKFSDAQAQARADKQEELQLEVNKATAQ